MVFLTRVLSRAARFKYWQRYLDREMQRTRREFKPIRGWVNTREKPWHHTEARPWTEEAKQINAPGQYHEKVLVEPIKEWILFKGDRVEVLVGRDKGKQGIINSIIKERNWCYVEGLNCKYSSSGSFVKGTAPRLMKMEKPLLVTTEVGLVDPSDSKPTEVEWRYSEQGEQVRVSKRTGRIIPLPREAYELEDFVLPSDYKENAEKDTKPDEVIKVTFEPKLKTFEQEIMEEMGIKEDRKPAKTYWY
ncbi:large ribosomal subunit protein uL24m-like [Lineus longissimus]|uniref:large ribosomal subunit protein uL24m-like n=1 Tax=Lineus longissimus TaxID=88925 RepID=UPI002B4E8CD2